MQLVHYFFQTFSCVNAFVFTSTGKKENLGLDYNYTSSEKFLCPHTLLSHTRAKDSLLYIDALFERGLSTGQNIHHFQGPSYTMAREQGHQSAMNKLCM